MEEGSALTNQELLEQWEVERDMDERDALYEEMKRRRLVPSSTATWEHEAGLYPDTEDPDFIEKIMQKQEFAENFHESFAEQQARGENPCDSQEEFELTPVQRFVSRFMSPQCPYNSALLYHGVGVGKTCAAITTAENYLRSYPRVAVFIVAPRNIQPGFRRTIYDEEAVILGKEEGEPNRLRGCTGSEYLKRTGSEYEREKGVITRRVTQSINARYKIMGYIQFWRYIQSILERVPKGLPKERREQEEIKVLRAEFSGRLVIVDEAHNLRDAPGETEDDNKDVAGGDDEMAESKAGKRLTPALIRVLQAAEGLKLMLLSGTPMYNSYREIIFLFNLLLLNDKKATISERDIFFPTGKFREGGKEKLGAIASAYLSFMRGENPLSFPVRLDPSGVPMLKTWPTESPTGEPVILGIAQRSLTRLPFVPVSFRDAELKEVRAMADLLVDTGGLGVQSIDEMVQTGNWYFPGDDPEGRIRDTGFDGAFEEVKGGGTLSQFTSRTDPTWLARANLPKASPKAAFTLGRMATAKGVLFVYSRFIKSGALPLAIALEANGYTPWGRDKALFTNGIVDGQGRQCALCEGRERSHAGKGHKFTPAKYVLLTGQAAYSPNNAAAIAAARSSGNADGREIKVVIGSQVASEGIDLRFIREIYVFDSWFHLNKMEQVLGRGVRTCSHSLLPEIHRNCTIYLLVNTYGQDRVETADLYMYRTAMNKALQIGLVTRELKRYALDCNLNYKAVQATGLKSLDQQEDAQGNVHEDVNINDTDFTSICDWIECPYSCAKPVDVEAILKGNRVDMTSYDEYAMRWRESQIKGILRNFFERAQNPMVQIASLIDFMRLAQIPEIAMRTILADIVGKKTFRIQVKGKEGYIVYRNKYYIFQPIHLSDVRIPLAMRVADVPVRKDVYEPAKLVMERAKEEAAPGAPGAPGAPEEAAEGAPAEAAPAAAAPAAAPAVKTGAEFWAAMEGWAETMANGTSELDIPIPVLEVIQKRYTGDDYKRAYNSMSMFSWMYEDIQRYPSYSDEKRPVWRRALAHAMLENVWDESLSIEEQISLFRATERSRWLEATIAEQRVKRGSTETFRYVVPTTGTIEYICGDEKCSEAVRKILEGSEADPLYGIQANRMTAGRIYGMILPKVKDGKLVFKTNDRPVDPGVAPEKGGECEIVSSIATHKKGLRDIREMILELGYPAFLAREEILGEKDERKKEKDGATPVPKAKKKKGKTDEEISPRRQEFLKAQAKLRLDSRKFQNVVKACVLKNILLRMVDRLEAEKPAGGAAAPKAKKYFYRPVAAIKARHKLK